jgi:hypothetical protein
MNHNCAEHKLNERRGDVSKYYFILSGLKFLYLHQKKTFPYVCDIDTLF